MQKLFVADEETAHKVRVAFPTLTEITLGQLPKDAVLLIQRPSNAQPFTFNHRLAMIDAFLRNQANRKDVTVLGVDHFDEVAILDTTMMARRGWIKAPK